MLRILQTPNRCNIKERTGEALRDPATPQLTYIDNPSAEKTTEASALYSPINPYCMSDFFSKPSISNEDSQAGRGGSPGGTAGH